MKLDVFDFVPVCDTAILAVGDIITTTTIITEALRRNARPGRLRSIAINDEDDQGQAFDVVFFSANVSLGTVNAAPSISDADARAYLGHVAVLAADFIDLGGVRVAVKGSLDIALKSGAANHDIYCSLICRSGTPTYTASGLRFKFGIEAE